MKAPQRRGVTLILAVKQSARVRREGAAPQRMQRQQQKSFEGDLFIKWFKNPFIVNSRESQTSACQERSSCRSLRVAL